MDMKKLGKILCMISPVFGVNGFYPGIECKTPDKNKSACQCCNINAKGKLNEKIKSLKKENRAGAY
jgi:hypothetical protein